MTEEKEMTIGDLFQKRNGDFDVIVTSEQHYGCEPEYTTVPLTNYMMDTQLTVKDGEAMTIAERLQKEMQHYAMSEKVKIRANPKPESIDENAKLIRGWAEDKLLHKADPIKQMAKLTEEIGELARGVLKNDEALTKDSIGDAFVVLTILAMQTGTSIEECVQLAYDEIKDRTGVTRDGVFIKASDLK